MSTEDNTSPRYMHRGFEDEAKRQQTLAASSDLATRRLLEDAGIAPGMRVLELGSGAGAVTLIAADLVGTSGVVVGIEANPSLVDSARERVQRAGLTNVSFLVGDLREVEPDGEFDAVVGRLILMHIPKPGEVLRSTCRRLRPGGIVAFQEHQNLDGGMTSPRGPLFEQTMRRIQEASRRAGAEVKMGFRLYRVFLEAGLVEPHLRAHFPVDHPGEHQIETLVLSVRSLLPVMVEHGIASEAEVDIDTLAERLKAEYAEKQMVSLSALMVDAWARKP